MAKADKGGCWVGLGESLDQVAGSIGGSIGGRILRHGNSGWKEFDGVRDSFGGRFGDVDAPATIMVGGCT